MSTFKEIFLNEAVKPKLLSFEDAAKITDEIEELYDEKEANSFQFIVDKDHNIYHYDSKKKTYNFRYYDDTVSDKSFTKVQKAAQKILD